MPDLASCCRNPSMAFKACSIGAPGPVPTKSLRGRYRSSIFLPRGSSGGPAFWAPSTLFNRAAAVGASFCAAVSVSDPLTDRRKGSCDNRLAGYATVISRRDVLQAGSLSAVAAGLGTLPAASGAFAVPEAAEAAERVSRRDWKRLADALSSRSTLYRPWDCGYPVLAIPFNHRYAWIKPAGIVACATTRDVREAIRWAGQVGLPAVPRSRLGHNYAGYSTTTGLLLNMARIRSIVSTSLPGTARVRTYGPMQVVHDAGTVTVGAGVTNSDLHPLLEDHGMFVPTGRCPTVGVAGLVLGA